MLQLKSEPREEDSVSSALVQAELDYWERLNFSFDMDKEQPNAPASGDSGGAQRSRSVSQSSGTPSGGSHNASASSELTPEESALLAQFAATSQHAGTSGSQESYESLTHALRALQGGYPYFNPPQGYPMNYHPLDQIPPLQPASSTFSWSPSTLPPPFNTHSQTNPPPQGQIPYPYASGQFSSSPLPQININTGTTRNVTGPQAGPSNTSIPSSPTEGVEGTEGERVSGAEDKRRRNTAASARFRIKKKQRTLNLERSVSDLSGRAEELEKEAAELRRENGWLKEIVMLKGRNLAPITTAEAESSHKQSDSLVGGDDSDASEESTDVDADKKVTKNKGKGKRKED